VLKASAIMEGEKGSDISPWFGERTITKQEFFIERELTEEFDKLSRKIWTLQRP
jgi:hypothetical protein